MIPAHPHLLCSPWWELQADESLGAQPVPALIPGTDRTQVLWGVAMEGTEALSLLLSLPPQDCLPLPTARDKRGVGEEAGRQTDKSLLKNIRIPGLGGILCLAVAQVQAGKAFQTMAVTLHSPGRILSVSSGFQNK